MALVVTSLLLSVAACSPDTSEGDSQSAGNSTAKPGHLVESGRTEVTVSAESGGKVELKSGGAPITVSLPAGAAPAGTTLTATPVTGAEPSSKAVTYVGDGIDVKLSGDRQPDKPVQITMDLSGQTSLAAKLDEGLVPVVLSDPGTENAQVYDAKWDPTKKTISAEVDHFSVKLFGFIELPKEVTDFAAGFAGLKRPDEPANCQTTVNDSTGPVKIEVSDNQTLWPCLEVNGGKVTASLTNRTAQFFSVTLDPKDTKFTSIRGPSTPGAAADGIHGGSPLLHPFSGARLELPDKFTTAEAKLSTAGVYSILQQAWGLSLGIMGDKGNSAIKTSAALLSLSDCIQSTLGVRGDNIDAALLGEITRVAQGCLPDTGKEKKAAEVSKSVEGPSLDKFLKPLGWAQQFTGFAGQFLENIKRLGDGNNNTTVTITRAAPISSIAVPSTTPNTNLKLVQQAGRGGAPRLFSSTHVGRNHFKITPDDDYKKQVADDGLEARIMVQWELENWKRGDKCSAIVTMTGPKGYAETKTRESGRCENDWSDGVSTHVLTAYGTYNYTIEVTHIPTGTKYVQTDKILVERAPEK
ncbi:hypothetical protein [Tsukamurella spumae]|uniref:Uncharacterized protein n=1 Tax=Tsukamurella spumae TaxID=44753 RepID=A0A846X3G4_9ACTN|nr:hypothetical protein [Tsukamurella spumae]NKY18869.1 hypothetical protein [Tsukamurella spumae]